MQNKRYWLRGGILFTVMALFICLIWFRIDRIYEYTWYDQTGKIHAQTWISLSYPNQSAPYSFFGFPFMAGGIIALFADQANIFSKDIKLLGLLIMYATGFCIYFGIGTFFGWLYGKIKNRKQ